MNDSADSSNGQNAAGVIAHEDSAAVFRRNWEMLERQGVIFCDLDTASREFPEFIASHDVGPTSQGSPARSSGVFLYAPPGVEVELPLQTYLDGEGGKADQFERTLIVADEGSEVRYIEGCSAPVYTVHSHQFSLVEIVVKPNARVTHTTIQNWSSNVFNEATKRAHVEAEGCMVWIDGNIGSRRSRTCPGIRLAGPKASGEVRSVAYAGRDQHQATGATVAHAAPETTSKVLSRTVAKDGGQASWQGLVRVEAGAAGSTSEVQCDAIVLDDRSSSVADPTFEIEALDAHLDHDVAISEVPDAQLFYLMSRGLSQEQALGVVVNGFVEPITRALPMEYAVEWSRLIELHMEGSVG